MVQPAKLLEHFRMIGITLEHPTICTLCQIKLHVTISNSTDMCQEARLTSFCCS